MKINDVEFNANLEDILEELVSQLRANDIPYLQKMKATPTHIQVCCPYHANGLERRPSAGIRRTDGIFHCFACGEVHSLYEVISHCFGHDDPLGKFGWTWLLKNFATVQIENRKPIVLELDRNLQKPKEEYVAEEELDKYRYYHPYWEKRGIIDERIIELFDLGFDKDSDCITMPIRNKEGKCVFVARRSVKTKWFNYPQGVQKPIYGLYELYNDSTTGIKSSRTHSIGFPYSLPKEIFICESMIDALLLWQSGFYAVALNGVGSSKQFDDLRQIPCRKYILCTDNDDAGRRARGELRKALHNKLITEIEFPANRKDVGECTREEIDNILDWEVF